MKKPIQVSTIMLILVLFSCVFCSCSQSESSIPSESIMPIPTNAPESYEGYWLLTEPEDNAFEGLEISGSKVYLYEDFEFKDREIGHNVANDYNIMTLDGKIYGCGYQDAEECLFEINADGTLTCTIFNYAYSGTHVYAKASTDEIDALIEYNSSLSKSYQSSSSSKDEEPGDYASVEEWNTYFEKHPEEVQKAYDDITGNLQKAIDEENGN